MKAKQKKAISIALSAAVLYAVNSPASKLLLNKIPAPMMAALLYLGAGFGLPAIGFIQKKTGRKQTKRR